MGVEHNLRNDLGRSTLAIFFIAGLLVICLWILRPFLPAVVWAATLAIATWPLMRRVEARGAHLLVEGQRHRIGPVTGS